MTSIEGHPKASISADPEKEAYDSAQSTQTPPDTILAEQAVLPDAVDPESNSNPPDSERTIRGFRWFVVCVAVFAANLLYGLDTTISADIQASVSTTYDNVTQLGWLGFGFGLGSTVAILPLGQAYGMFNLKWLYIGCLANFAAGSALCGAAPSIAALIVGRIWAGVGGAGMYLGTINIFAELTSPREQSLYVSMEGIIYGAGAILGPIVGGLLADSSATWRWAFYLNLVIFGVTAPMYLFALPSMPRLPDVSFRRKLGQLDWLGILLNAALYAIFTVAFGFGGATWAWTDSRLIASIVVFGVVALAFVASQRWPVFTTVEHRLFPCEFLADAQLVLLYIVIATGGAAIFLSIYYIPLYFLFAQGDNGTRAAVRLLPFVAFYVVSILVSGYALPRVGYHWLWFLLPGLLLTAGGAAMHSVGVDSPAGAVYGFSLLLGLGLLPSQASYYVACGRVAENRVAAVIQFINFGQGSAQLLALLIASAIFQNESFQGMQKVLQGKGYDESQIRAAIAGTHSQIFQELTPDLRRQCIEVIVSTIQKEWFLVIVAGALQTVCACLLVKKRFP